MYKIVLSILICVSCMGAGSARAHAAVTINEIMYDLKDLPDTNHEWVELYNSGDIAVSLQGWKFIDSSSHVLNAPPANGGQGSLSIEPNNYVILTGNAATFLADYPGFAGTVIDTVMSLNNTNATLSITDASGAVVDTISYTKDLGANGDGKALSRIDATTVTSRTPTPGFQNETSAPTEPVDEVVDEPEPDSDDPVVVTSNQGSALKTKVVPYRITTTISTKPNVGVPVVFSAKAFGSTGEELYSGVFVWSFGDGESIIRTTKDEFEYSYAYPGQYVVYVEYYEYINQIKPKAFTRKTIKVMPSMLVVSQTGDDGSIEISNTGNQEVNLRGWMLTRNNASFIFTTNVILLPKDKITLRESLTRLGKTNTAPHLSDPSGILMQSVKQPQNTTKISSPKIVSSKPASQATALVSQISTPISQKSSTTKQQEPPSRKSLIYVGLGSIVGVTFLALFFLRIPKKQPDSLSLVFTEKQDD